MTDLPPPPPADGAAPIPTGYDPAVARLVVQQRVAELHGAASRSTASIKQKAAAVQTSIRKKATDESAGIHAAVAHQKGALAAAFAARRAHIGAQVEGQRRAIHAAAEQEKQQIATSTGTRLEAFTADTEAERTRMHAQLDQQASRPGATAHADAARAEAEIDAAANEAREVGRREAAQYGGDEKGRAQGAAAVKVANDTAADIARKGPGIARELRGAAPSFDQKHVEHAATVDQQVAGAVPKVTESVQAESQAAASQLEMVTDASQQQLASIDSHVSAALSHAEAGAVQMLETAGQRQANHVWSSANQASAAVDGAAREHAQQIEQRTAQVGAYLLAAELPNPEAADEVVVGEHAQLDETEKSALGQLDAAYSQAGDGLTQAAGVATQGLHAAAAATQQAADEGIGPALQHVQTAAETRQASVTAVVAALGQQHQAITAGSLDQIKGAVVQAVASPTRVNDQFAGDSRKATDQSVAKAREPLGGLPANAKAAADQAGKEHDRGLFAQIGMGILKALGGLLIGLVIVIALALVVAFVAGFFGIALTAFGAMMIAGAILLAAGAIYAFYQRRTNPETAHMGVGKQMGLALLDAIGVTALYEGIRSKSIATGRELNLNAEERSEKITTGTISIIMLFFAARGAGARPWVRPVELPPTAVAAGRAAAGGVAAELWSGARLAGRDMMDWVGKKLGTDRPKPAAPAAGARTTAASGPRPTKLPDLVRALKEEATARGDTVGADKVGFIERDPSAAMTQALKAEFFRRVDARLQADPKLGAWDAMKDVVRDDPKTFLFKGDDIPPNVIDEHGGMTRIVDLESVYNHMLDPSYMNDLANLHDIHSFPDWTEAMQKNPSIFDPVRDCDPTALLSRKGQVGWWVPRSQSGQYSLAELVVDLALQRARYAPGTVRFTLDPAVAKMIGFQRPTPFDGIGFGEWGEAEPGSVFGVTQGGALEAVAPPIPVGQATGGYVVVPTGPYLAPALGGASIPSNVRERDRQMPAVSGAAR